MPHGSENIDPITLFLCGDVMTGRGVDQLLPHPCNPRIYESYVRDARDYVALAERVSGPIRRQVDFSYIWGDALDEVRKTRPDVKIINLETSITTSDNVWRGKGINYRMHPANVPCLSAAGIDCCALSNNHVLDWGFEGLLETIEVLDKTGVRFCGAGRNIRQAQEPAIFVCPDKGRVVVFSLGLPSGGVFPQWAAGQERPGVNFLPDLSKESIDRIAVLVRDVKKPDDIVVASIHWGGNWGYQVSTDEVRFAHAVIDHAGVDVFHGHSSHHVKGIEVYNDKLILYGCGDFLNDYEGITGYEEFRGDLGLMYFPSVEPGSGRLQRLLMTPTRIALLRVNRAREADAQWLEGTLNREGKRFGTWIESATGGRLELRWTAIGTPGAANTAAMRTVSEERRGSANPGPAP